jgi:hypothetical protein
LPLSGNGFEYRITHNKGIHTDRRKRAAFNTVFTDHFCLINCSRKTKDFLRLVMPGVDICICHFSNVSIGCDIVFNKGKSIYRVCLFAIL